MKGERERKSRRRTRLSLKISDTKEAFNETCTKLQDLREQRNELQKKRESVLAEIQDIELKVAHEQSSFEQLRGISMERYQQEATALDETAQIDLEKLPIFAGQLETEWIFLSELEQQTLLRGAFEEYPGEGDPVRRSESYGDSRVR